MCAEVWVLTLATKMRVRVVVLAAVEIVCGAGFGCESHAHNQQTKANESSNAGLCQQSKPFELKQQLHLVDDLYKCNQA